MRLIPSTYCQVFRSIYYDSAKLLSTISHIQMLWFLKWLQVTSSGSLRGNYQHIPAMSFSQNIISLSTAHVFAIGQDYIELFLELPGEPLKRTLKEGGSWQVPWTRSIESITLPWNTRSLTSWCFCSRCPAIALGQTSFRCMCIGSNCANKNCPGSALDKENEPGTVD